MIVHLFLEIILAQQYQLQVAVKTTLKEIVGAKKVTKQLSHQNLIIIN